MNKRRIFTNAAMSMAQTVWTAVVLFMLYRFLLKTIGIQQVGLWALLLATTSFTQVATFGLSEGLVKFVAKYAARDDRETATRLIQTAFLSVSVFMAAVLVAAYPAIRALLKLVVPASSFELAESLLPFAFLSFWLMMMISVLQGGLDGFQKISVRSSLMMAGTTLHFLLCLYAAPRFGLRGVAYSSVIQNSVVLFGCWIMLRRFFPLLPLLPRRWDKALFKEILSYGMKFQAISILAMFFEPLTKALLGRFGGLTMLGYYEMAISMVYKSRELINSATQTLVPAIADLQERDPEGIRPVYRRTYQVLLFLALPLFSLLIVCSPLVSLLWIGHYESYFVTFTIILSLSWFLNTLSLPAVVAYLGLGDLKTVLFGNGIVAVINVTLGFILGLSFGGFGVIFGRAAAIIAGGAVIYISFHRQLRLSPGEMIPGTHKHLIAACLVGNSVFLAALLVGGFAGYGPWIWLFPVFAGSIIFIPFWRNPTRKWLFDGAMDLVLNGRTA